MKSNLNIDRIWNEQDFLEFYQQFPKIVNCYTYTLVQLLVGSETLQVKVPTACPEQIYKFLLYKALYYHHLNKKTWNPLLQTARVSFFQPSDGFMGWYDLWACGKPLSKNCLLQCVNYQGQESIRRYKPLALIQEKSGFAKILARSCKDGNYYNISIYQNEKKLENQIKKLQESFKILQHPFISHLCQYHRTNKFSYFIFEHHPHKISHILENGSSKLTKKQVYTCIIQLLLALTFLEQQPILTWDISIEMIRVSTDGHIAISQSVVECGQGKKDKTNILFQAFQKLLSCLSSEENSHFSQKQMSFKQYVSQLNNKKKWSFKEILTHSWVCQQNIQGIICKNNPGLNQILVNSKINHDFRQLTRERIHKYFQTPYEQQYPKGYSFQSYKISCQSPNQALIKKYSSSSLIKLKQNEQPKRLAKTSSSLSLHKKERKPEFYVHLAWNAERLNKSPYEAALKKQSKVKKRCLQQ